MLITKAVSKFAGLLVLTLTLGGASLGQIKSGTIVGEATDPNGAAVPGANVSAINQETKFKPGINGSFGATVTQAFVDLPANKADPILSTLKVGDLQDTANTFGTYRQNTYDGRQIEFVVRFRF